MAVPKKKTSPSRRNMRRSHDALKAVGSSICKVCGDIKLSHHICGNCGSYRGRTVVAAR